MFEALIRDLKFSIRVLLKAPALTAVCIASLGLGIGANTAVFTIINAVFFKSLPVQKPQQLVSLFTTNEQADTGTQSYLTVSYPNFRDYKEQSAHVFSGLALHIGTAMNMFESGIAEQIKGFIVSGDYFDVLGVKAAAGRTFLPEEDRVPGANPVVVLSYSFWQKRFGGNPQVVGRNLRLNNQSFTVVGIAAKEFYGTSLSQPADFWVPLMMHDQVLLGRYHLWFNWRRALLFNVVGRLKPGVSMQQAQSELDIISHRLRQEYPDENKGRKLTVIPLTQATLDPNGRSTYVKASALLFSIVGLVLLITCANLASLLLARSIVRRKEIAIRSALGARRGLIVRQLLTESMLLAFGGGAVGLLIASQGSRFFWALNPPFFSSSSLDLSLDGAVLVFALIVSAVTGAIFGLVPALQASRPDLTTELRDRSNQQARTSGTLMLQRSLLVFQVSFSVVALVIAGLLVRSLRQAQQIELGFETEKLMVFSFSLGAQGYEGPRGLEYQRRIRERVESVPGVHSAAFASNAPLAEGFLRTIFPEGTVASGAAQGGLVLTNLIGTRYFESTRIPVLAGRNFQENDNLDAPKVAIVNEALAKHFWPGQDPVGRRFKFFNEEDFVKIIGVVKDSKVVSLREEPRPCLYTPLSQMFVSDVTLYVRTDAQPSAVFHDVESQIHAVDPALPIFESMAISGVIDQSLWAPRLGAKLVSAFSMVALLLVAVGIYGILAYSISQRVNEIGIRIALGAQTNDILILVLKQGVTLVLIGIGLGLIFSFSATHLIANLLFGVHALDLLSFVSVTLLLMVVAVLSSFIPARRAAKVSPMTALR